MERGSKIFALVKIGNEIFQKRFYEEGEIYLQTLDYFISLEKDQQRGDPPSLRSLSAAETTEL